MQSKVLLSTLVCLTLFVACHDSSKQNGLVYYNNFDSWKGWGETSRLTDSTGHSGSWCTFADSLHPFSFIFKLKFSEISDDPIRAVRYKAMCKSNNPSTRAILVLKVNSPVKENILFTATAINEIVVDENEWTEVEGFAEFEAPGVNDTINEVGFFLTNPGRDTVYADDFELEFFK